MLYNFAYLYSGITLGCSPGALLGLKNTLFWGLFLLFVQNAIMYVFLVVTYGAEFKFTCLNAWNSIVYPFWQGFSFPMDSKRVKKAQKWPKMTLFAPLSFIHPLFFSENFPKCGDICYEYKTINADPGKTLIHVPGGLLGLKKHPFWGLFFLFVLNVIMYVFLVVIYGADFKSACVNAWNFIFYT